MQSLLTPPRCAGCRLIGAALCARCAATLRSPTSDRPVPPASRVAIPWAYQGPARALVLALKLGGDRAAAGPLVDAMAGAVARCGLLGDLVTWVPGRSRDIRARGFDHARVLAEGLAARLGLPADQLLFAHGRRADQTGLTAADRRTNLEGAFAARKTDAGIVLVDDVMTTGATIRSCAGALIAGGARSVEAVAACRA